MLEAAVLYLLHIHATRSPALCVTYAIATETQTTQNPDDARLDLTLGPSHLYEPAQNGKELPVSSID